MQSKYFVVEEPKPVNASKCEFQLIHEYVLLYAQFLMYISIYPACGIPFVGLGSHLTIKEDNGHLGNPLCPLNSLELCVRKNTYLRDSKMTLNLRPPPIIRF